MVLASNRKAYHEFEILEEIEAGIELVGTEVKSVKNGKLNLKESYIKIINGQAYLLNCHISPYEQGNRFNHDPLRQKKLLMHKYQINKFIGKVQEKGLALTATKVYLKNRKVKVMVALVRGKKLHDKRQSLKERAVKREIERDFKFK